jgi:hypothetical protein
VVKVFHPRVNGGDVVFRITNAKGLAGFPIEREQFRVIHAELYAISAQSQHKKKNYLSLNNRLLSPLSMVYCFTVEGEQAELHTKAEMKSGELAVNREG